MLGLERLAHAEVERLGLVDDLQLPDAGAQPPERLPRLLQLGGVAVDADPSGPSPPGSRRGTPAARPRSFWTSARGHGTPRAPPSGVTCTGAAPAAQAAAAIPAWFPEYERLEQGVAAQAVRPSGSIHRPPRRRRRAPRRSSRRGCSSRPRPSCSRAPAPDRDRSVTGSMPAKLRPMSQISCRRDSMSSRPRCIGSRCAEPSGNPRLLDLRCEIARDTTSRLASTLHVGGVTDHEPLPERVLQEPPFPSGSLGDQDPVPPERRRVELHRTPCP